MHIDPQTAWFGPRRYGWGWGPASWQGWAIVGAYVATSLVGTQILLVAGRDGAALAFQLLLSVGLILVCIAKGSRPSWRWGSKNTANRSRHGGR